MQLLLFIGWQLRNKVPTTANPSLSSSEGTTTPEPYNFPRNVTSPSFTVDAIPAPTEPSTNVDSVLLLANKTEEGCTSQTTTPPKNTSLAPPPTSLPSGMQLFNKALYKNTRPYLFSNAREIIFRASLTSDCNMVIYNMSYLKVV